MKLRALWGKAAETSSARQLHALRTDVSRLLRLSPLAVAGDRQAYLASGADAHTADFTRAAEDLLRAQTDDVFHLHRFCLCCNETTPMRVDSEHGGAGSGAGRTVNWRERLVCARCGMNNRQRLVAKLAQQAAWRVEKPRIYLMEQVTPIFGWMKALPGAEVHGSEYLGEGCRGGEMVRGVRHEDVMSLSFADASFDLIVSNDVMEHIADPGRALRECARVLKPGGSVLATFPFRVWRDVTVKRARLAGNEVEHLLPPQYHGNPLSAEGSLVFHDFGWDLLDDARQAGFASADCEIYGSDEFGHLGPALLVFRLVKGAGASSD